MNLIDATLDVISFFVMTKSISLETSFIRDLTGVSESYSCSLMFAVQVGDGGAL